MIRLPTVILARVCSFLRVDDLKKLALLNRSYNALFETEQDIWNCLLRERYHYVVSTNLDSTPFLARTTYCQYDAGLQFRADFDGAHTDNTTYWTRNRPCPDSVYGKVMHLRHVWWLEGAIRVRNVPPGRYTVIWRVQGRFARYRTALSMFHTVVPLRAATVLGLSNTQDLIDQRIGDGWIQKAVGKPNLDEQIETPRYTYGFHNLSDGTVQKLSSWSYLIFPASLQINEISDIYCGTYETSGLSHSDITYDWVRFLPMKREDPGPITSPDVLRFLQEEAVYCQSRSAARDKAGHDQQEDGHARYGEEENIYYSDDEED